MKVVFRRCLSTCIVRINGRCVWGLLLFLSAEAIATRTMQDMQLKGEKRTSSTSLGDLERTTSLLSLCLSLQGIPVDGSGPVTKAQRRNASLALQCFNRAPSPHCEKSQWFLRTWSGKWGCCYWWRKQRLRNQKVAACFLRRLLHMEVAVFDTLPVRFQKKHCLHRCPWFYDMKSSILEWKSWKVPVSDSCWV